MSINDKTLGQSPFLHSLELWKMLTSVQTQSKQEECKMWELYTIKEETIFYRQETGRQESNVLGQYRWKGLLAYLYRWPRQFETSESRDEKQQKEEYEPNSAKSKTLLKLKYGQKKRDSLMSFPNFIWLNKNLPLDQYLSLKRLQCELHNYL